MKPLLAIAIYCFATLTLAAPCKDVFFTEATKVQVKGSQALIVTHPSTLWDGRFSSKAGMDDSVRYAKRQSIPVLYLVGSNDHNTYFFSDCKPDYWVSSYGGEFSFSVQATDVISVGGHWELCQNTTKRDLITQWQKLGKVDLSFTQVMDGLYIYGEHVKRTDSYYRSFKSFVATVSYRNPRPQWYVQKLSLLEMMGLIEDPAKEKEFLTRGITKAGWVAKFPDHQIELHVNGKLVEVLRKAPATGAPTLKLAFVDSLYKSGDRIITF